MALRAVIFGIYDVLIGEGQEFSRDTIQDLKKLFSFLRQKNVQPVVLSNRDLQVDTSRGLIPIDDYIKAVFGEHQIFIANRMNFPRKPTKACGDYVLRSLGLEPHEVIYVGNSKEDFITALQSQIIFLNATWAGKEVNYGFPFARPIEIARFIDTFGLRSHHWFYEIDKPIKYYSLGPYSTLFEDTRAYSAAARRAAKENTMERHFFMRSLISSMFFSDIAFTFDYIAVVPGHRQGFGNPVMDDALYTFANFLNKKYLRDLVVRHTKAQKSQALRIKGGQPLPETQLNTIYLNYRPQKNRDSYYKTNLNLKGKTVLVLDDFCTSGYSLEAVRIYLQQAGADTILVSWLKTINRGYRVVSLSRDFDPYRPQTFLPSEISIRELPYNRYIVDPSAPSEISKLFEQYRIWNYPPGI